MAAIFLLFICGINPLFRQGLIQVTLVGLIAVFLHMSAGKSRSCVLIFERLRADLCDGGGDAGPALTML